MIIARSSCSSGPPCEGNQAREAGRSSVVQTGAKAVALPDCERVSPNTSELVSASLHVNWVWPACRRR